MNISNTPDIKKEKDTKYFYLLFAAVFFEIFFFSIYGLSRHYNYLTSINDLGCFDQAIWGLLNGKPFLNTILFSEAVNWLGFHFHPVLAVFTPFYLVYPSVIWLILAQAIALPLTAFPVYFLAQEVTGSIRSAFFWSLIYLVNPFMLSAASWDFHPVSLAVPFIALACLALHQGKFRLLLLSTLFILLCKEHFGLMTIGFGLLWIIKRRQVWPGFVLLLLGCVHLILVLLVVMPAFSPSGNHAMFMEGTTQLSRYSWLGRSLPGVISTISTYPLQTAFIVFVTFSGWRYILILMLPLLGLPLLGGEFLLPLIGDLIANLLSANPMPRSALAYHSVSMVPILVAAAIHGSSRLKDISQKIKPDKQILIVLAATLTMSWIGFPFFSLPGSIPLWEPKHILNFNDNRLTSVMKKIKAQMSLSVQSNVGAHFSQRPEVYKYPNKVGDVDAVILRLQNPSKILRVEEPDQIGTLGFHLQMAPEAYLKSVRNLVLSGQYPRVYWMAPWLILMKGKPVIYPVDKILNKINLLEEKWGVSIDDHTES